MSKTINIKIRRETWQRLVALKRGNATLDSVIRDLIDARHHIESTHHTEEREG